MSGNKCVKCPKCGVRHDPRIGCKLFSRATPEKEGEE